MSHRNIVISASAGSGKTFQLSNRYLRLLLDRNPPETILAATFTRKAAGEILERVIARMVLGAENPKSASDLARELDAPRMDQEKISRTLAEFLRSLQRQQITTLDGFFARLAGCFGLELGLPPGWSLASDDELEEMQLEAIGHILEEDPGELADLIALLDKGQSRRKGRDQLKDLLGGLHTYWVDSTPDAWRMDPVGKSLSKNELTAARLAMVDTAAGWTGKREPKAHEKALEFMDAGEWSGLAGTGLGKASLGDGKYHGKDLPEEYLRAIRPVAEHALHVLSRILARQTAATENLLSRFHTALLEIKMQRRRFYFDDISGALQRQDLLARMDAELVAWRLESPLAHLLLDEFQDTSVQQWSVLLPLASELATTPDASFFAVGDAKQAIYGWRGGEARLLGQLPERLAAGSLDVETLDQSWRSSPVIIEFVNRVFDGMKEVEDLQGPLEDFEFRTHGTTQTELAGMVRIEEVEEEGDPLRRGAELAKAYLDAGLEGGIAILVRTGKAEARLRFELETLGVESSGAGGNLFDQYPEVTAILSLLRWIDHPGDTAAQFHVLNSPVGPALGLDESRKGLAKLRIDLYEEGYGSTLAQWTRKLAPLCRSEELHRLLALSRLGAIFDERPGGRSIDFVRLAQRSKIRELKPAPVQVMTIHQSKGLEFPLVILPELKSNLIPRSPNSIIRRRPEDGAIDCARRYPPAALQESNAEIAKLVEENRRRNRNEALCMLYVALTRAQNGLHLVLPPAPKKLSASTFAGAIRLALDGDLFEKESQGKILYERATGSDPEAWISQVNTGPSVQTTPTTPLPRFRLKGEPRSSALSPSSLEGGQRRALQDRLSGLQERGMLHGLAIHAGMEAVGFREDGWPEPDVVESLMERALRREGPRRRDLSSDFVTNRCKDLLRQLNRDTAGQTLSRERHHHWWGSDVELVLWREKNFLVQLGGTLLRGQYDRVVLGRREGSWLAADIVDFKTDRCPEDQDFKEFLLAKRQHYGPQLRAYARALRARTGLSAEKISARLLLLAHDHEIEFGPEELVEPV